MSHSASHSPLRSPSPRPSRKLTEEEINFLRTYLPAFRAHCATLLQRAEGKRKVKNTKGGKKDWVLQTVFQPFLKKFDADSPSGPNLDDLRQKICRWFFNHLKSDTPIATSTSSPKRPRAINAELVFGEEKKVAISEEVLKQSSGGTSEGSRPQFKLSEYNKVQKELFDDLEDNQKQAYTEQAAKRNRELKDGPDRSVIFANQDHITEDVLKALRALIGWNWGQHGDVVFFMQGAFRDEQGKLKLFDTSVGPNQTVQRFRNEIPDYEAVFRKAFKAHANRELGTIKFQINNMSGADEYWNGAPIETQKPNAVKIRQNDTGYPLLPTVDIDSINPANAATEPFEDGELVEPGGSSPKSRAPSRILSQRSPSSAKQPAATPKRTLVKVPDFSPNARAAPTSADINAEKRKKRKTDVGDAQSNRPAATKKQRIEEVIPRRTSSRIQNGGYVNKHVTVRKQ